MSSHQDYQAGVVKALSLPQGSMLAGMPMNGYVVVAVPLTAAVLRNIADAIERVQAVQTAIDRSTDEDAEGMYKGEL